MVATHDDGCLQLSLCHQPVQSQAKLVALSISQPADTRRQSLKFHALLRQRDPAAQMFVLREQFEHELIGSGNIRWFTGQRSPAKWSLARTEQRTYVRRHETGEVVGV